jgi:hypothetical protein
VSHYPGVAEMGRESHTHGKGVEWNPQPTLPELGYALANHNIVIIFDYVISARGPLDTGPRILNFM